MKLLLDTHTFLWMNSEHERLSESLRALLVDAEQAIVFSVVLAWEMGIKVARNKLTLPDPIDEYVTRCVHRSRMSILPIDLAHVLEAVSLPPHHGDPFDRMLVAQARIENLTLVTGDPLIAQYEVSMLTT